LFLAKKSVEEQFGQGQNAITPSFYSLLAGRSASISAFH
jgi:hypothetical protein